VKDEKGEGGKVGKGESWGAYVRKEDKGMREDRGGGEVVGGGGRMRNTARRRSMG